MKYLLVLQLWHLFKYPESTEVGRQKYKQFMDLLNKVRVGNINADVEKLLKARFIHESDETYAKYALYKNAEKDPAMKRNDAALNDLSTELYTIEVDDKIPDKCK